MKRQKNEVKEGKKKRAESGQERTASAESGVRRRKNAADARNQNRKRCNGGSATGPRDKRDRKRAESGRARGKNRKREWKSRERGAVGRKAKKDGQAMQAAAVTTAERRLREKRLRGGGVGNGLSRRIVGGGKPKGRS